MPAFADRVKESSTTTGTGTLTLDGAATGFQSFTTAFGNGVSVYYVIAGGSQWEVGIGTTGAGTLSRDTVLQSTNADALVDFAAGTKDVFCSYVADRAVTTVDAATLTNKTISGASNTLTNIPNSATTAASASTNSAIVARDASGNFAAGTITAALSGNATTATTLQTARTINGVSFNGSADITIPTGVFQSVNISPTPSAPYVITATDIGKRLVTNTVAPTLALVQLTSNETAAIANGSAVQIAAWTGAVNIDLSGAVDRGIADINGQVWSVALQSDGKILIGGDFGSVGGTSRPNLARLNADGTLDTTFAAIDTNGFRVRAIAVQSDGKVIIGGDFASINFVTRNYIARLNSNGSLDTSYDPNCSSRVATIALQSDGKAVIGGEFTVVGSSSRDYLARLNTDGTVDSANISPSGTIECVVIQPDQKILIGGVFTSVGGSTRNYVARLNANFTLDTFNPNASSIVSAMAVQSDGKVLLAGQFTTVFGTSQNYIARANADGTRDTTFSTTGANNSARAVAIESDGKIVVGGDFTSFGGSTRNYFARLSATGALDSFAPSFNNVVNPRCILVQSNGRILAGGTFTTVAGITARNFVRLIQTAGTPIVLRAPYSAGTQFPRYTVVTVEKMDATTWWITESNVS